MNKKREEVFSEPLINELITLIYPLVKLVIILIKYNYV